METLKENIPKSNSKELLFSLRSLAMDMLKKAALAYKNLLDKEYLIVVGKNNIKRSYVVQFTTDEFKHICGLHKLKDNNDIYRSSSGFLFRKIIRGNITVRDIEKSKTFPEIEERIKNAAYLEEYFDRFTEIYDWEQRNSKFSKIDADLMIPVKSAVSRDQEVYIFLKNCERNETLVLAYIDEEPKFNRVETSIVDKKDYRKGQLRPPALLFKEKINLSDRSRDVLFCRPSFSMDKEEAENGAEKIGVEN